MAMWYEEGHEDTLRISLKVIRSLFVGQSDFQRVEIVETELMGKALAIDGFWMTSERDERHYHEMIVHPAMCTAPKISRVLIIGGGDGGTAREVLRYPEVEHVDMVEIDGMVVEACKQYLPEIGSAWDDPRLHVHIADGIEWAKRSDLEPYDIILVDGTDPVGPAVGLFNEAFYRGCANLLSEDGVFATQSESPELYKEIHLDIVRLLRKVFGHAEPYYGNVMIYPGDIWSWTFASRTVRQTELIERRVKLIAEDEATKLYNRDVHLGAFAQPNHIRRALAAQKRAG